MSNAWIPQQPGLPGCPRHGVAWLPPCLLLSTPSNPLSSGVTAAEMEFPNGRAQVKILFRNNGKWRLSGTGHLHGADGEERGHLGECDTDT